MAASEQVLELFESYWFDTTVLIKKSPSSSPSTLLIQNTFPQRRQRVAIRSFTDQTMASTTTNTKSSTFWERGNRKTVSEQSDQKIRRHLIELEIKELKGFMDLGFLFSKEDKGCSRLVSLISGLQKMGRRSRKEGDDESVVSVSEQRKVVKRKEINPMMFV